MKTSKEDILDRNLKILEIYEGGGVTQKDLASRFGITPSSILMAIKSAKRYRDALDKQINNEIIEDHHDK